MNAAIATVDSVDSAGSVENLSFAQARIAQRRLEGWLTAPQAMALAEAEVELEVERQGREVLRLMLEAHIRMRGTGDLGPALRVVYPNNNQAPCRIDIQTNIEPGTQTRTEQVEPESVSHRRRRVHERTLKTVFGEISVARTAYAAAGHGSIHPLDESAALPNRMFSYPLQQRVVKQAVQGPFDEALANVKEAVGVKVHKRSIEQITVDGAVDFDAFYEQRTPPPAAETGSILVSAVDCKGVPMHKPEQALRTPRGKKGPKPGKKRMATVAAVFTQQPRTRTPEDVVASLFDEKPKIVDSESRPPRLPGPEHKRVWASLEKSKADVIAEVAAECRRRDPLTTKTLVTLTDGERALQNRLPAALRAELGEVRIITVLDLMHVLEKLWKAAYCFHVEGSDEAEAWMRERSLKILQGGVSQVVKGLRQSATKRGFTGAQRKTVDAVTGYLYRNRRSMRYDAYLAAGLPIASGSVEGACKNLIKDRMERSGMRWTPAGAEAMLKLRAAYKSGDFEDYWDFHVRREQERLHPAGRWSAVGK